MGAQESTSPYLYKQKALKKTTTDDKNNKDLNTNENKFAQKKLKSKGPIIISFDKPNNLPYHIEEINQTGYCLRRINEIYMMYDVNACSNDLVRKFNDKHILNSNVFLNFRPYTKESSKHKEKKKKEDASSSTVKASYGKDKNNEALKPPQNLHVVTKGIIKTNMKEKILDSASTTTYSTKLISLPDNNSNNNAQSGIEITSSNLKFFDLGINSKISERSNKPANNEKRIADEERKDGKEITLSNLKFFDLGITNKISERSNKPANYEKRIADEERKNGKQNPSEKSFLNTSGFLKKLEENKMKEPVGDDKSDALSKISANKSLDNSFEKSVIRSYKYIFDEKNEAKDKNQRSFTPEIAKDKNQRSLTPDVSFNKQEKLYDYLQKNPNFKTYVERKSPNTSTLTSSNIIAKQKQQYSMISKSPIQESDILNIKLNLNQFQKKSPDRSESQADQRKNILQLQREKMGWNISSITPRK